jgi:predicted GH43/DUF377 family glycosyl hydrolase
MDTPAHDATCVAQLRTPHKRPGLALAPSYRQGEFDSHAVDCPFVFSHEGRFYMTFIGWDGIGYRTGLAVSDNLIDWRKESLILDRGPRGSVTEFNAALTWIVRDNALYGAGSLKRINGRYLGTYHAYPRPGYEAGSAVIGLCWSDDLRQWELEPPCLRCDDGDTWERGGLYKSCLVEREGRFYLFYNAKTSPDWPWVEQTGLAVSDDLKGWARHPLNPVLRVGAPGAFDDLFCSDPCVVWAGDRWALFYFGNSSDGHARDSVAFSEDLLHWRKSGEVLLDVGAPGAIDSRHAHKPSMFHHAGVLYHYYCAVSPAHDPRLGEIEHDEVRGIAVATSRPV